MTLKETKMMTNKMNDEELVQIAYFITGKGSHSAKRSVAEKGNQNVNDILVFDEDLITRKTCYEKDPIRYIENLKTENEDDLVHMMRSLPRIAWPFVIGQGSCKVDMMAAAIAEMDLRTEKNLIEMS